MTDWEYLRHKYTTGDMSLDDIASLPHSPHLTTIKKRAAADKWTQQRDAYRYHTATKVREMTTTTEADVSARHVKIAQELQSKALQALQRLDVTTLPASEIRQFLATATDIERKALGMDNKFTLRGVGQLDKITDAELLTLARRAGVIGDDPEGNITA